MKFHLFVLLLLFCGLLLCGNCSLAYTWDEFLIYCQSIASQEITTNNDVKNCAQYVLNNKAAIVNSCTTNMDNFDSFICGKDQSTSYPYLVCANSINVATPGSTSQNGTTRLDGFTTPNFCCKLYSNSINSIQNNKIPINQVFFNAYTVRIGNCMGLTTGTVNNNGWGYFNAMEFYHGPVFTPTYNRMIDVYNGSKLLGQAYGVEFGYVFPNQVTLGYISNYPVGTWSIEGVFGPAVYYSGDSFIIDSSKYQFDYQLSYGIKSNKLGFDFSTGRVYVSSDILLDHQLYFLGLMFKENSSSDYVEIGPDVAYYSYLYTNSSTSGDYLSPNLNSTVDLGFVSALEEFFSISSGDKQNLDYDLNSLLIFSGDFLSGDFFSGDLANKLGYYDYLNDTDNDYSLFVYRVYRAFLGEMKSNDINSSVSFVIHNNTYTIYASDFHVPDGPLKSFVSLFVTTIIVCLIIYWFHAVIIAITTLDLIGIANSFNQDHTIFM